VIEIVLEYLYASYKMSYVKFIKKKSGAGYVHWFSKYSFIIFLQPKNFFT